MSRKRKRKDSGDDSSEKVLKVECNTDMLDNLKVYLDTLKDNINKCVPGSGSANLLASHSNMENVRANKLMMMKKDDKEVEKHMHAIDIRVQLLQKLSTETIKYELKPKEVISLSPHEHHLTSHHAHNLARVMLAIDIDVWEKANAIPKAYEKLTDSHIMPRKVFTNGRRTAWQDAAVKVVKLAYEERRRNLYSRESCDVTFNENEILRKMKVVAPPKKKINETKPKVSTATDQRLEWQKEFARVKQQLEDGLFLKPTDFKSPRLVEDCLVLTDAQHKAQRRWISHNIDGTKTGECIKFLRSPSFWTHI